MKTNILFGFIGLQIAMSFSQASPCSHDVCAEAHHAGDEQVLKQVSFDKVELTDRFWTQRMKIQKERLTPIAFERTQSAVEDLKRTAAWLKGDTSLLPSTSRFVISDLFKVMEGAAYLLKMQRDPVLEKHMDDLISIIGEAQEPDGYLYPAHTTNSYKNADHWGGAGMGDKPYSWVVHSHEVYNMGHLYEAAIAYHQATGKKELMNIAEKNAIHINKVFFEGGDPKYNNGVPVNQATGHEETELALVKLYQATNNKLYLDMAQRFIDIRGVTYQPDGKGVMSPEYAQQHLPVREQTEAVGHAVRATYLYSGMADVCLFTGDKTLQPALHAIWKDIVDTRMHITGGLGAVHGIEGFGPQYVLPNANAFDETCAAVGNVLTNFRLFLMEKDGKYMDVAEVALLNNALAGVNLEGDKFFYINPLEHDGVKPFNQGVNGRFDWFGTACCPSNIARLVPQIAGMMYAYTDNEIYCSFYAGSKVEIPLKKGKIALEQASSYPFDGYVSLNIRSNIKKQVFALKLRIPTWAQTQFVPGELYYYADGKAPEWEVKVNGKPVFAQIEKGFASISREWHDDDLVELYLPMPVRFVEASDKVEDDRGRIAVTRGPLVFCAEGVDNDDDIFSYYINNTTVKTDVSAIADGVLKGIPQIMLPAMSANASGSRPAVMKFIPYYAWFNREPSKMMVWLPRSETLVKENFRVLPDLITKVTASHTYGGDHSYGPESANATIDGLRPLSSDDNSIPRWTSWPQRGVKQWVQISLKKETDIQSILIYWFQDNEGVRVPQSWYMEYKKDGNWVPFPIYVTDTYGVERDKFNMVHPGEQILTKEIRVNILPDANHAVGILEIIIEETK